MTICIATRMLQTQNFQLYLSLSVNHCSIAFPSMYLAQWADNMNTGIYSTSLDKIKIKIMQRGKIKGEKTMISQLTKLFPNT